MNITKKWTVFFLMRAVSEYWEAAESAINELLSVQINEHISLVICLNINAENIPTGYERGEETVDTGMTTVFYEIVTESSSGMRLRFIKEKPDFNIQDSDDVKVFFRDFILTNCQAERYILFTWDHGQPFGIFPDKADNEKIEVVANKKIHSPLFTHFRQWQYYRDIIRSNLNKTARMKYDKLVTKDDLDMLTVTELKNAIIWAFGSKKIDILIMVNCYLQFFDTGFELSQHVKYLLAYEAEMLYPNPLDYKKIFETLSDNLDISSRQLSQLIISTFAFKEQNISKKNKTAFFANDLSWYGCMAKLINELALNMVKELPRYFDEIKSARSKCDYLNWSMPEFCLIDFKNFVDCLYNEVPSLFSNTPYGFFTFLFDKIVVDSFVDNTFLQENTSAYISPSIFSIYFPNTKKDYKTNFSRNFMKDRSLYATEFVTIFEWDNFIDKYIYLF